MDDYRLLWEALTKEPGNSLALAQLLMLFLGLTAEEVCALDSEDLLPIPNYRAYQLRITKRCVPIKKNDNDKNYIVSGELPSSESYRNVPVDYIDFNNAHKQYHMCVQVSYGLMAVAAPGTLPPKMPNGPLERKHHIDGVFNYVLHTRLHIRRPCTVTITSAHGVNIKTEEGCLRWESENL